MHSGGRVGTRCAGRRSAEEGGLARFYVQKEEETATTGNP